MKERCMNIRQTYRVAYLIWGIPFKQRKLLSSYCTNISVMLTPVIKPTGSLLFWSRWYALIGPMDPLPPLTLLLSIFPYFLSRYTSWLSTSLNHISINNLLVLCNFGYMFDISCSVYTRTIFFFYMFFFGSLHYYPSVLVPLLVDW